MDLSLADYTETEPKCPLRCLKEMNIALLFFYVMDSMSELEGSTTWLYIIYLY